VYRFAADWTGPQLLFNTGLTTRNIGITYDGLNNSLWVTDNGGQFTVTDYALDGSVISSFNAQKQVFGLAFDAADGTIWGNQDATTGVDTQTFYQYSTDGTLLGTATYSNIGANTTIRSIEFAEGAAPEPGTLSSLCIGMVLIGAFGLRKRLAPAFARK
jgi:hypothetical protein